MNNNIFVYLKTVLLLFSIVLSNELFSFDKDTLFICKTHGIKYQNITTAGKAVAWLWNFQSGSDSTGASFTSSTDSAPIPVFYNTAGIFLTTIKTTFSTGADSFDQVIVVVRDWPMPKFYFPDDTGFCAGAGMQITLNTTAFPNLNYLWNTGAATRSISVNSAGTYSVILTIQAGTDICETVYDTVDVTTYPSPSVNLGPDKFMCQNQVIVLNAGGGAGDVYLWQPDNEVTKTINVSMPGIYKVRVTNADGCFAEDEVEMLDSCPHYVFVPNAVSPNEDLLNDLFTKVWNFKPKEYTFRIFNRWGELLYETNDINAGWDCKFNSELVCQDIYVYKITYVDNDKKWYEMRGTFFVVR